MKNNQIQAAFAFASTVFIIFFPLGHTKTNSPIMILPNFLFFLTFLLGLVSAVELKVERDKSVQGPNEKKTKEGKGHEKVSEPGYNQFLWSQVLTFDKGTPDESQLAGLAKKAHEMMRNDWPHQKDMQDNKMKPMVMTALQIDKEVYLASSMKGDYPYTYRHRTVGKPGVGSNSGTVREYVPHELKGALKDTQGAQKADDVKNGRNKDKNGNMVEDKNNQHKNDAQCGEVFATWTYLLKNAGKKLKGHTPKPKVVTWEWSDKKGAVKEGILNPCTTGREEQWGCEDLCKHFGFEPVEENTCDADDWPEISHTMQQPIDKDGKNQEAAKSSIEEDFKGNQEVVAEKEKEKQKKKEENDAKNREKGKKDKEEHKGKKNGESSKGKNGKRSVVWNA